MSNRLDLSEIRKVFNQTLPVFEQHFKMKVDYTPESLQRLQDAFDEIYPIGTRPHPSTAVTTGYYVGEVFIRNIKGAQWDPDLYKNSPLHVTMTLPGTGRMIMAHPPEMVADYIFDPRMSIYKIFEYYKDVAEGRRQIIDRKITGDLPSGVGYTVYNNNGGEPDDDNRSKG